MLVFESTMDMHAFHSFRHAGKRGYARCICIRTIYEHRVISYAKQYYSSRVSSDGERKYQFFYVCVGLELADAEKSNGGCHCNAHHVPVVPKRAILVLMMNASEGVVNK